MVGRVAVMVELVVMMLWKNGVMVLMVMSCDNGRDYGLVIVLDGVMMVIGRE